jgi:aminomethyltransferase
MSLLKTVFHEEHLKLKARMVPFSGYDMPVQYSSLMAEHQAVRTRAGLFDVAHMGVLELRGSSARRFLDHLLTRRLRDLAPGSAAYSLMCRDHGGCVDDLIVYCLGEDLFWLVLNAGNKHKDLEHIQTQARGVPDLEIKARFEELALIALQGPSSFEVLHRLKIWTEAPPKTFKIFERSFEGKPLWMSTTGYTGERGVEIAVPSGQAVALWQALVSDRDVTPAGLGCRDTLRTEMGYPLYGHELNEDIHPLEAGLGWAVQLDKGEFIGAPALRDAKANPKRKFQGLINRSSRQAPRAGMPVLDPLGKVVGQITSGTFAPSLNATIGMALIDAAAEGPFSVDIRGTQVLFESCKRPFYNPAHSTPSFATDLATAKKGL